MESLSEVTLEEFRESVKPEDVRVLKIIFSTMALGVISFGFIIILLNTNQSQIQPDNDILSTLNIMTWFNMIFTIFMIFIGKYISEKQYSRSNLQKAINKNFKNSKGVIVDMTPARKCIAIIRISSILRLATLESPAFFGLVAVFLLTTNGENRIAPIYYLNFLTALPILFYIAVNFPTSAKIMEIFKTKIQTSIY
jgi:hypothetical protein